MARKRIAINGAVFLLLDDHCAVREDAIENAGQPRWIETSSTEERAFLTNAKEILCLRFTATKQIILYQHESKSYFCTIGFEHSNSFPEIVEEMLSGGMLTAILADAHPKPIASTLQIRNIVEALDRRSKDYQGHDKDSIASLFPRVAVFSGPSVLEDEAYRVLFRICLAECSQGDYWLDSELVRCLYDLSDLDSIKVPYQTLCRSIFDADPAAFFLAMYRCIEALYALKIAKALVETLELQKSWSELSVILEAKLGWRPQEAHSLNSLLAHAEEADLKLILIALGLPQDGQYVVLSDVVGSHIYKLRNAMVHYRPIYQKLEYSKINWNSLCVAMTGVIRSIYQELLTLPVLSAEVE